MAAADPEPLFRELVKLRDSYARVHAANITLGDTLEGQSDVIQKQAGIIEELRRDRDRWQGIAEGARADLLKLLSAVARSARAVG